MFVDTAAAAAAAAAVNGTFRPNKNGICFVIAGSGIVVVDIVNVADDDDIGVDIDDVRFILSSVVKKFTSYNDDDDVSIDFIGFIICCTSVLLLLVLLLLLFILTACNWFGAVDELWISAIIFAGGIITGIW